MTLLSIIQDVADDLNLERPSVVVGNTSQEVRQLLQIAQREGRDLAARFAWKRMVKINTFTLTAAEDQGLMNSTVVTSGDFDYMINGTFWDRTTSLPITGPVDETEWQTLKAFPVTGPYLKYRLFNNRLYINPTPAADSVAFEYKSTHWCESSSGTGQVKWTADSDIGRLDERLMTLGILWRWKARKGLEYQEDFISYERMVKDAMGRDKSAKVLNAASGPVDRVPGVFVPVGSWNP
jgi:hypothetical protein